MAEIRVNTTGTLKLFDADDSHSAGIAAGTITSDVTAMTLNHNSVDFNDDIKLLSDAAVIHFGADSDVTLTHDHNTGLILNTEGTANSLAIVSGDDATAAGPSLNLKRDSASPADNDGLGAVIWTGRNDNSQDFQAAIIKAQASDVSDGTEDSYLYFRTMHAGSETEHMAFLTTETVFNDSSNNLDLRVESDQSDKAFFVNGEYGHCHITGASSATKVAYYSGGLGALQLGLGGFILSYDYNVIDGPYILHNEWFDGSTTKYVADGEAARFGVYDGRFIFYTANSGSANASVSQSHRFEIANNGTLTGTDTDGVGSNSDQRLKENIQDYNYDLSKFKLFKPRTFDWKNPEAHTHEATTGFIAQEVESVDDRWIYSIPWDDSKLNNAPKETEEKALCDGEDKKASKLGRKDAMYISVIQQLITRIEALEG
jgi:hypothetical protein